MPRAPRRDSADQPDPEQRPLSRAGETGLTRDDDVLAIVGALHLSRDGSTQVRQLLHDVAERQRPEVIVTGNEAGVAAIARHIADDLNIPLEVLAPAHAVWRPFGYEARAEKIADRCTRLVRVKWSYAMSLGDGHAADLAEAAGKPVRRVQLP